MRSPESVSGVDQAPRLVRVPCFVEPRGKLIAAEAGAAFPFQARRYFLVQDVPTGAARARHAQRLGHELLSCVAGACTVEVRWRGGDACHRLADPADALYVPPWVWVECREFSADAVLLVLCSLPYDPADQITDFAEFEAGPAL